MIEGKLPSLPNCLLQLAMRPNLLLRRSTHWLLTLVLPTAIGGYLTPELSAQTLPPGSPPRTSIPNPLPPSSQPQPSPQPLPPPEQLFQFPGTAPTPGATPLPTLPGTVTVQRFEVLGSTVFDAKTLAAATTSFLGKPLTFPELLQAADAITRLYTEKGYITSGAFIPANQTFQAEGGVVTIQVLEGSLETIQVKGTQRLDPGYIRSRLAIAGGPPLNLDRLLAAMQLLQLDPLIASISGELAAGSTAGKSALKIAITEAKTFSPLIAIDNARSPSVGTVQRQFGVSQANLTGLGDRLAATYINTDGSQSWEASYTVPVSPYNTTVGIAFRTASNRVIEQPFNALDINASSRAYDLTVRQPLIQTPNQEIAVGLTLNRQESETSLLGFAFPLSTGANSQGQTRISALRLFQEFTQRDSQQVLALRSQVSLGLGILDATINATAPDSRFLAWRGQAQYAKLLQPDTLLLLRSGIQVADRALVPLEQLSLGGVDSIRGYRQDYLLSDNGLFASGEVRLPIVRVAAVDGLLQVTPFIDLGVAWNTGRSGPNPSSLLSGGVGLLWQQGNFLTARLQWGIPFISVPESRSTWQENGLYFSIVYTPLLF